MTAHEIVAKARKLPQVSDAVLKLVGMLDDADSNADETIALIKSDGLLTAKLLKVCNSSAMGLSQPVSSVDQAVMLLGYNQVLSLVLSLGFGGSMKDPLPAFGLGESELSQHAFLTAIAAELIIHRGVYANAEPSVAFTAGLLHDFGKLVMAPVLNFETQSAIHTHMSAEGLGSVEAEREVIGTDHAEVGACLLHMWRLPDWIVESVANHHKPVLDPAPRLSAVSHLANRMAHLAAKVRDSAGYAFKPNERILQVLELDSDMFLQLIDEVGKSAAKANELVAAA